MNVHSLMLEAPLRLRWVAQHLAPPGPGDVALRTLWGAVSIGTELALIGGRHRGSVPVRYPRMTGYESYAEVIARGPGVSDLQVGARVVATYGHRTGAVLAADRVVPVPAEVSHDLALLTILACDADKGIAQLAAAPPGAVLVTGMGTLGLLTLFGLVQRGFVVDVVEPQPRRRELAAALGARRVVHPADAAALAPAYRCAIECSGRDQAFGLLQDKLGHGGTVCVLSDGNHEPLVLRPTFHERELRVVASSDGQDYRRYAAWFLPRAASAAATLRSLFELTVDANDLADVLPVLAGAATPPLKILVRYFDQGGEQQA